MKYKDWLKKVEDFIIKQGYSYEFANAISICVKGLYTSSTNYLDPELAAQRGLFPLMPSSDGKYIRNFNY